MKEFNSESGKSILEIVIMLVIIAIVVTFAFAQLSRPKDHFQRQNMARELKVYLERARFDSVKRRAEGANNLSRVVITSSKSFSVTTDLNQNGTLETPAETRVVNFSGQSNVQIMGTGLSFPVTMSFDRHGHVTTTNSSGTEINPIYTFCDSGCTLQNANSSNATVIFVSPSGTVSMTAGGETLPVFQAPSVTNVNSSLNTYSLVQVIPTASPQSTPY